MRRILKNYLRWIVGYNAPTLFLDNIDEYYEKMITNIHPMLHIQDGTHQFQWTDKHRENKLKLCANVLFIYRLVACQPTCNLSMKTWETLLNRIQDVANDALKNQTLDSKLLLNLRNPLLETLFHCYIQCTMLSENLWKSFKFKPEHWKKILPRKQSTTSKSTTDIAEMVVRAWKKFVYRMTIALIESMNDESTPEISGNRIKKTFEQSQGDSDFLPDKFSEIEPYLGKVGLDRIRARRDFEITIETFPPGFQLDVKEKRILRVDENLQNKGIDNGYSIVSIGDRSIQREDGTSINEKIEKGEYPMKIKFRAENFQTMFVAWDRFINVLGPLTDIEKRDTSSLAIEGFSDCVLLILNSINTSRGVEKSRDVKRAAKQASGF
eukprot:UN30741